MKRRKQILAWLLMGAMLLTNVLPLQASELEEHVDMHEEVSSTETESEAPESEETTVVTINTKAWNQ